MTHGEVFDVRHDVLSRSVAPSRGRPYEHCCTRETFVAIARHIDASGSASITIDTLYATLALPHTQIAVAIAFLKERGCLVVARRRSYAATRAFFEDAMCEYHSLEHFGPDHGGRS